MPCDTGAVANYFLDLADRDGVPVSPMKLQKLLYYAHGWHLAITDKPLLDEQVEAWQFGPVVASIYHEFKEFGPNPIKGTRYHSILPKGQGFGFKISTPKIDECEGDVAFVKDLIEKVWNVYKGYSAVQLSKMTHQPGSPWDLAWKAMGPVKRKSKDIDDEDIKKHFKSTASSR